MELKAEQWLDYSGEPMPCYPKHEADAYIARQKYKRCLWLARWCASRSASWYFDPANEELHKSDLYDKWKLRWLELAEKFKEAK